MTPRKGGRSISGRAQRNLFLVSVTEDERKAIQDTAQHVRLPVSALLRKLALGYEPSSKIDLETLYAVVG